MRKVHLDSEHAHSAHTTTGKGYGNEEERSRPVLAVVGGLGPSSGEEGDNLWLHMAERMQLERRQQKQKHLLIKFLHFFEGLRLSVETRNTVGHNNDDRHQRHAN